MSNISDRGETYNVQEEKKKNPIKKAIKDRFESEDEMGIKRGGKSAWTAKPTKEDPALTKKQKKNILKRALDSLKNVFDWSPGGDVYKDLKEEQKKKEDN